MAHIVDINEYRRSKEIEAIKCRSLQQREFFINLYRFLNRNLNNSFEKLLVEYDCRMLELIRKHQINSFILHYFHVPMITFMVTTFICNSDLAVHFPEFSTLANDENQRMFKETLIKIIESYCQKELIKKPLLDRDLTLFIDHFYLSLLTIIPQKILLV